jgi:hypothetical protein
LADLGYTLREFFVTGTAVSYKPDGRPPSDGCWDLRVNEEAPFATRIFVITPTEHARFNGSVVVEWLNVSSGRDAAVEWRMTHRALVREGFAYVGVSAQKVGVEGGPSLGTTVKPLKDANPVRYAELTHPGDAFSYDIFSQIGEILRAPGAGDLLGPLVPQRLIAAGVSQSAMYLTTYVAVIDMVAPVFDGFLVHSRFGYGAGLHGQYALRPAPDSVLMGLKLPSDLRVPVLTVITETDLIGDPPPGYHIARQPDAKNLRIWEIAGSAHADNYIFVGGAMDSGFASIEELAAAYAPINNLGDQPLRYPVNFGPQQHYVTEAALVALDRWIQTGAAPPAAPPLQMEEEPAPGETPRLARDFHGIALGGVRTPWVDVPTARLAGTGNSGPLGAWIVGVGEPFDLAKLNELYPGGQAQYMERFEIALTAAIQAGFILPEDRQEILNVADFSFKRGPP